MTQLRPTARHVYVVRWQYWSGRLEHRFYVRPHFAHRLAQRLTEAGLEVRMYTTTTNWRASRGWP